MAQSFRHDVYRRNVNSGPCWISSIASFSIPELTGDVVDERASMEEDGDEVVEDSVVLLSWRTGLLVSGRKWSINTGEAGILVARFIKFAACCCQLTLATMSGILCRRSSVV